MRFEEKNGPFCMFSLFSQAEIICPIWINNFLNEYFLFNFELNIELNHFLAQFNVKMNNQNVSAIPIHSPQPHWCLSGTHVNKQTCCHQANVYIVNKMGQPCRMLIRSAYPNQQMVTSYILETTSWTAKYQHVHVDKICLF